MSDIERRFATRRPEIRRDSGKSRKIVGYAGVYYTGAPDTEYRIDFGGLVVRERIQKGAFDDGLKSGGDVIAYYNHGLPEFRGFLLGRRSAGTLRVHADEIGLRYEIDMADTERSRDLAVHIERGDVPGSSFAFDPPGDADETFDRDDLGPIRNLSRLDVVDVGPVDEPAYTGTSTAVRSRLGDDLIRRIGREDKRKRLRALDLAMIDLGR